MPDTTFTNTTDTTNTTITNCRIASFDRFIWICLNIDTKTLNLVSLHYIVSFVSFQTFRIIRVYAGQRSQDLTSV